MPTEGASAWRSRSAPARPLARLRNGAQALPSFASSSLGTHLSAKLCFAGVRESVARVAWPPHGKRSFQDICVPKRELGNEESDGLPQAASTHLDTPEAGGLSHHDRGP